MLGIRRFHGQGLRALTPAFLALLFLAMIGGIVGIQTTDTVRTFLYGNALYAKAQKTAVYELQRHLDTGDPAALAAHERAMDALRSLSIARIILTTPELENRHATSALARAGIERGEGERVVTLFPILRRLPTIEGAVAIWARGDKQISDLEGLAATARAYGPDDASTDLTQRLADRLARIDRAVTDLHQRFAERMNAVARTLRTTALGGIVVLTAVLTGLALVLIRRTAGRLEQTRRALQSERELFRDIARVASDWMWQTDRNHRLTYLSDRFDEVSEIPSGTRLGRPLWESFDGVDSATRDMLRALLNARQTFRDVEIVVPDGSGDTRWFLLSATPSWTRAGAFAGHRGIGAEITEQRRTETRLRQARDKARSADRIKTQFLANMSHELRTPLNAIIGYSEMIDQEFLGPIGHRRYQEYAGDILTSGRYLLGLVDNVLDITGVEAGERTLSLDDVPLREIAADAICLTGVSDHDRVRLSVSGEPLVRADRRALTQALVNVLANALKFSDNAPVDLAVSENREHARLSVRDQGPGIPDGEVAHVTEPFYTQLRVPMIASANREGSGIGLAVTKSLVEAHQGHILIESAPGRGTTVHLDLPAYSGFQEPLRRAG